MKKNGCAVLIWLDSPELEIYVGHLGSLGVLVCVGWQFKKYTVGCQVVYKEEDKKSVCHMEVVFDDDMRIWNLGPKTISALWTTARSSTTFET